jgi:hypothetical protein
MEILEHKCGLHGYLQTLINPHIEKHKMCPWRGRQGTNMSVSEMSFIGWTEMEVHDVQRHHYTYKKLKTQKRFMVTEMLGFL